jgi:arabinogalactan endo-1,4-beta-galactosidase
MKKLILLLFIVCVSSQIHSLAQFNTAEKILGADISFLPQLESRGIKFQDHGIEKDALKILKDHGFNYIRLRVFNNPSSDSGYSPKKGFCDLEHTKQMALRIKAAGMKFLLDFHYSDTWADPAKQFKPSAWKDMNIAQLTQAVHDYTKEVITALQQQNTLPDMVQVGNEINHGIIWPDGNLKHLDNLAEFLKAGISGVKEVNSKIKIMLHIACGGQNAESRWFIDSMLSKNVVFDVIGESYYPKWHGTIDDLRKNLNDLSKRYIQDIIVVEYSEHKREVNDVAFSLQSTRLKGTFIWEPLNTWEAIFDKKGNSNELIDLYEEIIKTYGINN